MKLKAYFKDLVDPSIIAGILIILAVTAILTVLFSAKVKGFKQNYKSKFVAYTIIVLLVSALVVFIGSSEVFNNQIFSIFIFYQSAFFILGIIHCYIFSDYFDKFENPSPWIEILFSLLMVLYILIPFILVYTVVKGNIYVYDMMFSCLVFVIPTFIYLTFEACLSIPPKTYITWVFPAEHAYPDPPENEYRDMVMLTFVFHKEPDSDLRTVFNAKAPIRMDFGRLFYHFVNDYNLKNPDSPINLLDKSGQKQHWIFYLKSKYLGLPKLIKPATPLYANRIEENSIIICQRAPRIINSDEELKHTANQANNDSTDSEENIKEKNNVNF